MSEYLLINIVIIAVPLLFTFEKKMKFYRRLPEVFTSMFIVGLFYIIWDIYATENSHWSFNPDYILNTAIFGLPLEEILFFITVPYAMLFLFEVLVFYLGSKIRYKPDARSVSLVLSIIFLGVSVILINHSYSFLVLISCSVYFFIAGVFYSNNINSGLFWLFILLSYIPFIGVNYLLTSFPVVIYNPDAIIGTRFLTIPIEDFFYSFSLISFYVMTYTAAIQVRSERKLPQKVSHA
jgi:lycopene cyclase domain-containing protein